MIDRMIMMLIWFYFLVEAEYECGEETDEGDQHPPLAGAEEF